MPQPHELLAARSADADLRSHAFAPEQAWKQALPVVNLARMRTILTLSIAGLCAACSHSHQSAPGKGYETLALRYEGSANTVSPVELAEDLGYLAPIKLQYMGNNSTGGPHSIQAALTGDTDFGSSFNGAIIHLIARKAPLRAVLASYGTDEQSFSGYYTLADSPVHNARDLIGKTVAINTLGAHAEFVLMEYLHRGGVSKEEAKQVTMVVLPPVNGEQALRNHQVDVVCFSTMLRDRALERGGIRMLFSDYQIFGAFNAGSYVMSDKFVATHPNAARKFVQATAKAIDWERNTPRDAVVARFVSIMKKRHRNEDSSAVKYWHSSGIASEHGRLSDRDFQLWVDWLVNAGEYPAGGIKLHDLYTNALNGDSAELAALKAP